MRGGDVGVARRRPISDPCPTCPPSHGWLPCPPHHPPTFIHNARTDGGRRPECDIRASAHASPFHCLPVRSSIIHREITTFHHFPHIHLHQIALCFHSRCSHSCSHAVAHTSVCVVVMSVSLADDGHFPPSHGWLPCPPHHPPTFIHNARTHDGRRPEGDIRASALASDFHCSRILSVLSNREIGSILDMSQ